MELEGPAYDDADQDSHETRRKHQDQSLVEVEQLNPELSDTNGAQDSDLLCLVVEVCAHRGTQREETKEHQDRDYHREDVVYDLLDCLCGLLSLVVFSPAEASRFVQLLCDLID